MRQEGKKEKMIARKFKQAPRVKKHSLAELSPLKATYWEIVGNKISIRDFWNVLEKHGEILMFEKGKMLGLFQRADVFEQTTNFELYEGVWRMFLRETLKNSPRISSRMYFYDSLKDDAERKDFAANILAPTLVEMLKDESFVLNLRREKAAHENSMIAFRVESAYKLTKGRLGQLLHQDLENGLFLDWEARCKAGSEYARRNGENTLFMPEIILFQYGGAPFYLLSGSELPEIRGIIEERRRYEYLTAALLSEEERLQHVFYTVNSSASCLYQMENPAFVENLPRVEKIVQRRQGERERAEINAEKKVIARMQKEQDESDSRVKYPEFDLICPPKSFF